MANLSGSRGFYLSQSRVSTLTYNHCGFYLSQLLMVKPHMVKSVLDTETNLVPRIKRLYNFCNPIIVSIKSVYINLCVAHSNPPKKIQLAWIALS